MGFWLGMSEVGFRLAPQAGLEPASQPVGWVFPSIKLLQVKMGGLRLQLNP